MCRGILFLFAIFVLFFIFFNKSRLLKHLIYQIDFVLQFLFFHFHHSQLIHSFTAGKHTHFSHSRLLNSSYAFFWLHSIIERWKNFMRILLFHQLTSFFYYSRIFFKLSHSTQIIEWIFIRVFHVYISPVDGFYAHFNTFGFLPFFFIGSIFCIFPGLILKWKRKHGGKNWLEIRPRNVWLEMGYRFLISNRRPHVNTLDTRGTVAGWVSFVR